MFKLLQAKTILNYGRTTSFFKLFSNRTTGSTIIFFISLLQKHTLISKWGGLTIVIVLLVFNYSLISSKKSDALREEYLLWEENKKKRFNIYFYAYLIISILLLILSLAYTAYYKNKYGNYDL